MNITRTQEEIAAQIAGLEEIKPSVRRYTAFGDSNWSVIEAQIKVLEGLMDEDEIYEYWNRGEEDMRQRDGAMEAYSWLIGEPLEYADNPEDDLIAEWRPLT